MERGPRYLIARGTDVDALAVFLPLVELIVVYATGLDRVVAYDRAGDEVFQPHTFRPNFIYQVKKCHIVVVVKSCIRRVFESSILRIATRRHP